MTSQKLRRNYSTKAGLNSFIMTVTDSWCCHGCRTTVNTVKTVMNPVCHYI